MLLPVHELFISRSAYRSHPPSTLLVNIQSTVVQIVCLVDSRSQIAKPVVLPVPVNVIKHLRDIPVLTLPDKTVHENTLTVYLRVPVTMQLTPVMLRQIREKLRIIGRLNIFNMCHSLRITDGGKAGK